MDLRRFLPSMRWTTSKGLLSKRLRNLSATTRVPTRVTGQMSRSFTRNASLALTRGAPSVSFTATVFLRRHAWDQGTGLHIMFA